MNDPKKTDSDNIFTQDSQQNEPPTSSDNEPSDSTPFKSRFEGMISSAIKKTITHGLGAFVNSEDGLKLGAGDFRLHREILQFITTQISALKKEIIEIIADESHAFLTRIHLSKEIQKALSGLTIHVEAKIRLSDTATNEEPQTHISITKETVTSGRMKKKKEEKDNQK